MTKKSSVKHKQIALNTTNKKSMSYSNLAIGKLFKKSREAKQTQQATNNKKNCMFWLKKKRLSTWSKSKHKSHIVAKIKKTENKLKQGDRFGYANSEADEKRMPKQSINTK
jgi:hypothetical protein